MTVIAYRDGVLAADSLMVMHDRKGYTQKLFKHGDDCIAVCGDYARALEMLEWYRSGAEPDKYPAKRDPNDFGRIIVANKTGLFVYENGPVPMKHSYGFTAYGTGADFAIGAMEMGADAVEACRVAITWCASCGGEVEFLRVE